MFGQLDRLETLTYEISRKLDVIIEQLRKLVEQQEQSSLGNNTNTFTVTIDEPDAFREFMSWTGQEGQE